MELKQLPERESLDRSLFLNTKTVDSIGMTFNFIYGMRGAGKSYGIILNSLLNNRPFIYLRRTDSEVQFLTKNVADMTINPVTDVLVHEFGVFPEYEKIGQGVNAICLEDGTILGMIISLSNFSGKRGFEYEQCQDIIFDECVPENHVKSFKSEETAFFNFYESINRNREMQGGEPIRVYMLCNSNNMAHPLLLSLGMDKMIQQQRKKGKQFLYDKERSLLVWEQASSDFIKKKKRTALYKLTKGTTFYGMALENEFVYNDMTNIKPKDLKPFRLITTHEKIDVYVHKSENEYYIKEHNENTSFTLANIESDNTVLQDKLRVVYGAYVHNRVWFETFNAKQLFLQLV